MRKLYIRVWAPMLSLEQINKIIFVLLGESVWKKKKKYWMHHSELRLALVLHSRRAISLLTRAVFCDIETYSVLRSLTGKRSSHQKAHFNNTNLYCEDVTDSELPFCPCTSYGLLHRPPTTAWVIHFVCAVVRECAYVVRGKHFGVQERDILLRRTLSCGA